MVVLLQALDMALSDSKADGSAVSASTGGLFSSEHSHLAIATCSYKWDQLHLSPGCVA